MVLFERKVSSIKHRSTSKEPCVYPRNAPEEMGVNADLTESEKCLNEAVGQNVVPRGAGMNLVYVEPTLI